MTWSYGGGGGSPTASSDTCDGTTAPPPFDTTKFESLYWGINKNNPPQLAMDGAVSDPGETMTFNAALSNLAVGRLVWTGTTQMLGACAPAPCINFGTVNVDTKLTLQFTNTTGGGANPAALVDPATAGVDPSVGGVVSVSPALTNFDANFQFTAKVSGGGGAYQPALLFYNSYSHQNPAQDAISHFTGAFYLVTHPPIADFSCTPAAPVAGDTVTCTSSSTDPDGQPDAPLTEKWDWNGNGSTSDPVDQTGHSASGTFDAGSHTIVLHALDNEGGEGTVLKQIVVAAPPGTPGGNTTTGGTTGTPIGTPGGGTTGTDTTAPVASLALAKAKLKALLKKGLAGSLTSNEVGTGKLSLTLPAKLAKKLKLKGPVGSVTVRITTAGKTKFNIKLSKKAAKKLAKLKSVAFKVAGTVTDQAGNRTAVSKSITVKR